MNIAKKISKSPLAPLAKVAFDIFAKVQFGYLNLKWKISGKKMPTAEQAHEVTQNVTFMFKSFERQKAGKKKLYKKTFKKTLPRCKSGDCRRQQSSA